MTQIIAFAGKKQSGKSTACNSILAMHLADLGISQEAIINKKGEIEVTDLWGEKIEGQEFFVFQNGLVDNFQINIDSILEDLHIKEYSFADKLKQICIEVLGLTHEQCYGTDEQKNQLTALQWKNMPGAFTKLTNDYMTGREVLQYIGSDIFRAIYEPCWTQYVIHKIKHEQPDIALISDVRFINEVKAVQNAEGFVVKLLRSKTSNDKHSSENDLDDNDMMDAVIDNENMTIPEQNEAIYNTLKHLNIFPSFN